MYVQERLSSNNKQDNLDPESKRTIKYNTVSYRIVSLTPTILTTLDGSGEPTNVHVVRKNSCHYVPVEPLGHEHVSVVALLEAVHEFSSLKTVTVHLLVLVILAMASPVQTTAFAAVDAVTLFVALGMHHRGTITSICVFLARGRHPSQEGSEQKQHCPKFGWGSEVGGRSRNCQPGQAPCPQPGGQCAKAALPKTRLRRHTDPGARPHDHRGCRGEPANFSLCVCRSRRTRVPARNVAALAWLDLQFCQGVTGARHLRTRRQGRDREGVSWKFPRWN